MGLKNTPILIIYKARKGSQFCSQLRSINLERVLIVAIDAEKNIPLIFMHANISFMKSYMRVMRTYGVDWK
jgi:hypothetical protein